MTVLVKDLGKAVEEKLCAVQRKEGVLRCELEGSEDVVVSFKSAYFFVVYTVGQTVLRICPMGQMGSSQVRS